MRKIVTSLFVVLLPSLCFSQEKVFPKNANGEYEFSEVIETDLSKSILYSNAISWAMNLYGNYKDVVQYESENDGKLVINGFGGYVGKITNEKGNENTVREEYSYTISIDCKDKKYRYIINNIKIKEVEFRSNSLYSGPWEKEVVHEKHLENITTYNAQKDSIESLIADTPKGTKIKKLNTEKELLKEKIRLEEEMYNDEYSFYEEFIKALKSKMASNSDF